MTAKIISCVSIASVSCVLLNLIVMADTFILKVWDLINLFIFYEVYSNTTLINSIKYVNPSSKCIPVAYCNNK